MNKGCIIGILLSLILLGCGSGDKKAGGPPGGMMIPVVGFDIKGQELRETISLVGTLMPNEIIDIRSEIDGVIDEISFEEGERVREGDTLLTIDRQKLQAEIDQVEAELALTEATLNRYQPLISSGAVSQQEYDEAQANLKASKANLILTQERLNDAFIKAPFDGVMGQRLVSRGQFITTGAPISVLVNQDPIKVEFNLPERYIHRVAKGQQIEIRIAAYPNQSFQGEVFFIDPRVDEQTRTVLIKALIPNPDGKLLSGMFASLDLFVEIKQNALLVPETALIIAGDSVFVYMVDVENIVSQVAVTTGIREAGQVEILSGLEDGQTIIIEGIQKVRAGAKVMLTNQMPPAEEVSAL